MRAVAEKCAPYLHPRLSSVAATVRRVSSLKDLSDDELAALAADLGGGIDSMEPLPLPARETWPELGATLDLDGGLYGFATGDAAPGGGGGAYLV